MKEGDGIVLCTWGIISYEDIFGIPHTTKFGIQMTWLPNGSGFSYYIPGL